MNRENKYWRNRANLRMDEYHKSSDETIVLITSAYDEAIRKINEDINKIFYKFMKDSGLTKMEIRELLNSKIPKKDLDDIRNRINQIQDDDLRAYMMAEINAEAYKARITRLEALKESIYISCMQIADIEIEKSTSLYIDNINKSYHRNIYDIQKGTGIAFDFATMPTDTIEEILKNNWSGKHFSERVWKNTDALAEQLTKTITSGLMAGTNSRKMATEIQDLSEYGKHAAERLIRTETTYVTNMAEIESYKECGIEKYVFVATLDLRTSKTCREHDKKIYEVAKAVPGENLPPLHPYCRSTTIAYKDEETLNNLKRRARDPQTGKTYVLPKNMSYDEWYKKYVLEKYGNDKAEVFEKMIKNKSSDRKQHKRYIKELNEFVPKKLEDFQRMKYTNKEEWSRISYQYKLKTVYNLDRLKHTENFASKDAIRHILEGEINRRGKAVGFHMENMPTKKGIVIENTRSLNDKNGVYSARVIINGVHKVAKSTFFPTDMTPQQVVDAINEAYTNKTITSTDEFIGETSYGFKIGMYLNKDGDITTAYPKL